MNSLLQQVKLQDGFFAPRQQIGHQVTIPAAIRRCEETGRLNSFRLDWQPGQPDRPHVFWDSDVAKVLEGMAYDLELTGDPALAAELDQLVDLVIAAQQPDGYLNVYFTVVEPDKRWKNIYNWHELYCAGHLIEAAVAHFQATGTRKFLDAMCRYADHIAMVFGPAPAQKHGYPGHEEIELALVKLYRTTGEKRYLELAKYFIDQRGQEPNFFLTGEDTTLTNATPEYLINRQAHRPVREQNEAVGHAVRALYLYCGMVDVAVATGDSGLLNASIRLFDNVVTRRMYVTGGVGSTPMGEAFTRDFSLPNDTAYAESCAAIALALLAERLLDATGEGKYADVLERVLYNGTMSGLSLSGDHFFYANLLEVNQTTFEHDYVKRERQPWFLCSCCPTSYCRFLPQLGRFCYTIEPGRLRINIPVAATIDAANYQVAITGRYPYDGEIAAGVIRGGRWTLEIRIPDWCKTYSVKLNGDPIAVVSQAGYCRIDRDWRAGDALNLALAMPVEKVYSHPAVATNAGKVAIRRGPLVYCVESTDNPNIEPGGLVLPINPNFSMVQVDGLPEGTKGIVFDAEVEYIQCGELYRTQPPDVRKVQAVAVPFALWQNRGADAMQVFLRTR